jgi:hypothetical protein
MNEFYTPTGNPTTKSAGSSQVLRSEYELIEDAFDKLPTLAGNADELVVINSAASKMTSIPVATLSTTLGVETISNKDVSGGYVGMTLFRINFRNTANSATSFLTNSNTGARTYTFPDATGTMALTSDLTPLTTRIGNLETSDATKISRTSVTGSAVMPSGNSAQRDAAPVTGYTRFNTDTKAIESYDGTQWLGAAGSPVGSVIPFIGGYFTNASNGGFSSVLGNTAGAVNTLLNNSGWYVCDGAALNLASSPIFNGGGRYLPNLTDNRFIMGSTAAGVVGGANTMAHTHTTGDFTLTDTYIPAHTHPMSTTAGGGGSITGFTYSTQGTSPLTTVNSGSTGSGTAHNHGSTGAATVTENRPLFLSCIYIMRVR